MQYNLKGNSVTHFNLNTFVAQILKKIIKMIWYISLYKLFDFGQTRNNSMLQVDMECISHNWNESKLHCICILMFLLYKTP